MFLAVYRGRVELELGAHRGKVAAELVKGATTRGPGQAAMQKLYWQRLGELTDTKRVQIEDPDAVLAEILGISRDRLPPTDVEPSGGIESVQARLG